MTDFHSHILPGMDDGAPDTGVSLSLLRQLRDSGVTHVCLTPHFRAEREKIGSFLSRREEAYGRLCSALPAGEPMPELTLGAEILLCHGLSDTDLSPLAVGPGRALLLELPAYEPTMQLRRELEEVSVRRAFVPVIAHLDRCDKLSRGTAEWLFSLPDAVIQFNCDALASHRGRALVRRTAGRGLPILFGSDCHNETTRRPRFDLLPPFLSSARGGRVGECLGEGEAAVFSEKTSSGSLLLF